MIFYLLSNISCFSAFCFIPFFNFSALLPSRTTNAWPLQTGSMRVRGQAFIACFASLFFFFYISTFSFMVSLYLCYDLLPSDCYNAFIMNILHISCRPHRLAAPFPLHQSPFFPLSPLLHLSQCSIWCCLSSCQYLCPLCSYHLAAVTSICEASLVSALLIMLPHAVTTLFVSYQYRAVYFHLCCFCLCGNSYWYHLR